MKNKLLSLACAAALGMAAFAVDTQEAHADSRIIRGIIGGVIAGAVIGHIVRAGQHHCHQGLGCHSHGYARAQHYHQVVSGPILYYQAAPPPVVVQPAPPPVVVQPGGYAQAHYQWCFNRFKSYHAASNTYQPYGNRPRAYCRSPYGG